MEGSPQIGFEPRKTIVQTDNVKSYSGSGESDCEVGDEFIEVKTRPSL